MLLDHAKKASRFDDDATGVGTPPPREPSPLISLAPNNLIDLPGFGIVQPAAVQNKPAAQVAEDEDEDEDDDEVPTSAKAHFDLAGAFGSLP